MLTIVRKTGSAIGIDENIRIKILSVSDGGQVRIGIDAPADVMVYRQELYERTKQRLEGIPLGSTQLEQPAAAGYTRIGMGGKGGQGS